ncbi:Signal transduction histidine kinase [Streptomyces sp. 2112.3]|uniref:sensor histidine kinase n=1 Tax=Streptomyces sp. 2112.3 TaxID=1881023 RepID=UPI000898DCD2|nr:sensor histidine kinase [Streptomyces sp. 2112.3]SEE75870.1 Signal transduction histidine kinase [Streptomyces sp. 2112.3]
MASVDSKGGTAGPLAGRPVPPTPPGFVQPRSSAQQAWDRNFRRWGGYPMLGLGVLTSAASADELLPGQEAGAAGVLVAAALALQVWWSRAGYRLPAQAPAGQVYYLVRFLLAFTLTWLNPFFAIYAMLGNFDAGHLLRPRFRHAGLLGTAVIMSGSQSGGLPPASAVNWVAFGLLFLLNAPLVLVFSRLAVQEAEHAAANAATIAELARTNARLESALEENVGLHAQLLVQAREAGIADERRRLAAEIHDTLAQGLAGIITQLEAATESSDPAAARGHARRAMALARDSLGEARRSVHNLGPGVLEHAALPDALRSTVEEWSAVAGVRAEFTVTGTAEPLHDEVEATLLRIAQEGLANARRHADASRVGVTLSYMGDEVTLDIRDDGRGFDPAALPPRERTGGFGLGGMRARAERIAGAVGIESEPGQGTAVSARVPLVRHG